jgi:hypothetical protein
MFNYNIIKLHKKSRAKKGKYEICGFIQLFYVGKVHLFGDGE